MKIVKFSLLGWELFILRQLSLNNFNYVTGMGRNSSRIASRRIASNSREPTSYAGLLSDDEDDADWAGGPLPSERRKRKIKTNNNRKPTKVHKYVLFFLYSVNKNSNSLQNHFLSIISGPQLEHATRQLFFHCCQCKNQLNDRL